MKHKVSFNRLSRKPAHRKALHRNMVTSLLKHERIKTTEAKAKAVRRTAEKMVTRAKEDSVHNRRIVAKDIKDEGALSKLFTDIAPRFQDRPGGYTRILKMGPRKGDASERVLLEFVEGSEAEEEQPKRGRRRRRGQQEQQSSDQTQSETAGGEAAE